MIVKKIRNGRYLLAVSAFVIFLILTTLPILYIFISEFSVQNYSQILRDKRLQRMLIRTLEIGLGVSILATILGLTLAIILECTDIPFKNYLRILVILPLLIPPYILGMSWLMFLGRSGDFVERTVQAGQPETYHEIYQSYVPWYLPFRISPYNMEWVIFLITMAYFPLVTLIISFALRNVDSRLEESARLIYGPTTVLRRVTIPLLIPHIIVSGLFVFIFAITELDIPSILRVFTTVTEVFIQSSGFFDIGQAAAASLPLVVIITVIILLIHITLGNRSFITISSPSTKKNLINLTPFWKIACLAFAFIVILLSVFIPLSTLIMASKFMFLNALEKAKMSIINTLFLACVVSSIMLMIGFIVAYFSRRSVDPIILFPLVVPSAIMGIGLIRIWNTDLTGFIYTSFLILVIAYSARYTPFVIKTLSPFIEQIHPSIEEAARLNGASFFKVMRTIIIPLTRHGISIAWIMGFVLCLRELTLAVLLTPPGFQTLSNRIFTLYHYGETETVASLSLILMLMILCPVLISMTLKYITKWRLLRLKE